MRTFRWLVLAALAIAVAAALVSTWAWRTLHRPHQGYPGDELRVEIEPGLDARSILGQLERQGALANALLARIYLVYRLKDPPLKAGEYRFSGPAATPEVLERLIRGKVVTHAVTLVEGWTLEETARHLADQGFGDYDALLWEMSSPAEIADLDAEAPDLEGYLFPDTYSFARGTPEREIVTALVANFRRRYEGEIRPLLGPDDGRSVRQIVTLASVVEKEAQLDEERPLIAGVYANRLERGIALYADPTVIYALKKLGRWDGNLRRPDLEIDSPYNTYRYPGLPPGPIASPGLASLKAAAQPADVSYLFFVSRNDGSHVFAATLAEHNRNVYKWQKVYWRQRWAEKKSAGGG
ncbi:MAG: endolytic transglycosylase MltG [Thermoanaerobaculia bacterium]